MSHFCLQRFLTIHLVGNNVIMINKFLEMAASKCCRVSGKVASVWLLQVWKSKWL